jgi:hypothetical protein
VKANEKLYWFLVHTWHHWLMGWVYLGTGLVQILTAGFWWPDWPGTAAARYLRWCMRKRRELLKRAGKP